MKKYSEPEVEITMMCVEDVITASSQESLPVGEEDWDD